jgi:CRISPR-associated protein Cas1
MRIKRSRTESALAGVKARSIQELLKPVASAAGIDSVRGYEGRGSAFYFEALPKGFVEDWDLHAGCADRPQIR